MNDREDSERAQKEDEVAEDNTLLYGPDAKALRTKGEYDENDPKHLIRRQTEATERSARYNGCVAIMGVVGAAFLFGQLYLTQRSLEETKKSADAAVAAVAESQRQFNEGQRGAAEETAKRDAYNESVLAQMKRTNAEAGKSNDLTRDSLERSLRSWLAVPKMNLVGELQDDPFIVTVNFENVGQSPMENISYSVRRTVSYGPSEIAEPTDALVVRIAPSEGITSTWRTPKLTPNQVEAIESERLRLRFRGLVTYGDQFQARRPAEPFCFRWNPKDKNFTYCTQGEAAENY